MNVGGYFVIGLLAFGVAVGFVVANFPQLNILPVATFTLPLALSFIVDLALMPLSRRGRVAPLTMEQRFIGVLGSAVIATAIVELSK